MNAPRRQRFRTPDVVDIVRIAAIDDDVVGLESPRQFLYHLLDSRRGDHQPGNPRLPQRLGQLLERRHAARTLVRQSRDSVRVHVVSDAFVAAAHQASYHVRAHSSEADHAHLH